MADIFSTAKKEKDKEQGNKYLVLLDKYFNYILIGVVILIFVFGYLFLIRQEYATIQEKARIQKEKEDQISKNTDLIYDLAKINQAYKSIGDEKIMKIAEAVPAYKNIEDMFSQMEVLINKQGMLLDSMALADSKREKGGGSSSKDSKTDRLSSILNEIEVIGVNMSISGVDYAGLRRLLSAIENNIQPLNVEKVTFSPEKLSVVFSAKAYFIK